jgi:hypothetical protein
MSLLARLFITYWFGFACIGTVIAAVSAALLVIGHASGAGHQSFWFAMFAPGLGLGVFAAGYGFHHFAWWLSRGGMDYLSNRIARALSKS